MSGVRDSEQEAYDPPMARSQETLRVGTVPFLVARPLDEGLGDEPGIELAADVPAKLVEKLRSGEIDVALVSSIELFRQPGYRYLDGLAVSGRGFVASVQVFLRKALEEVRSIALDPASRAAATLVQVMLAERGTPPSYHTCALGEDPRGANADAWLRIGDRALREYHEDGALPVFNPSAAWCEATGLPFVFATWIVRPGVDLEPWHDAFLRARERGEARREALAEEASRAWSLSLEACREYLLDECVYEPGSQMADALLAFRDRAARIDLCEAHLEPRPIEDPTAHAS